MATYSLAAAAEILGTSRNTLSSWLSRGAPAVERADRNNGKEWKLRIGDVVDWRVKTSVDDALAGFHGAAGQITKDEADRRKAVAQARMTEVELDEKLKSVILVSDAIENAADFAMALRSGLDNVAVKCAGRTATLTDPNEIRELIEFEINRAMEAARQILDERWSDTCGDKVGNIADADDSDD